MKKLLLIFSILFSILFFGTTSLADAPDPTDTVQSMVNDLKSKSGFKGMLDYVHWQSAYDSVAEGQRAAMGVSSPQELRQITLDFLTNPAKALEQRLESQLSGMTPEQKTMMQQVIAQQQQNLSAKLQETQEKMARAEYKIGEATVTGNEAQVPVTTTVDGKTEQKNLKLVLIEGKWYLPTGDIQNSGPLNFGN